MTDTLIEATKKCERAQYTSDVDGILEKKKKQRKKNIVKAAPISSNSSDSSESGNDSDFPTYFSDTEIKSLINHNINIILYYLNCL